jgi:hypothetical protein
MKNVFSVLFIGLILIAPVAQAQDFKPDDRVIFDLAAEDWVTTKTAHVTASVDAAVSASNEAATRTEMIKAVGDLASGDWRLTSFTRNQDQTGLEHWSAIFEARLPEAALGGLNETAKKLSKPGMQLSIIGIDFTPTLEEMEAARGALRETIYKLAGDQLAALNAALPGRNYRIALVNFTGDESEAQPMPHVFKGQAAMAMMAQAPSADTPPSSTPVERSQKVLLAARIVCAATEPKLIAPTTAPAEPKH